MSSDHAKIKWLIVPSVLAGLVLIVVVPVGGFVGLYLLDASQNRGFTFGYYGTMNTISNALEAIEGISVVSAGGNEDITLEEFAIRIQVLDVGLVCLSFGERDPIREMSGDEMTEALKKKIEEESGNNGVCWS